MAWVGEVAEDVQETSAAAAWWSVAGLVLGALVAAFAGVAGARTVHKRNPEVEMNTKVRR